MARIKLSKKQEEQFNIFIEKLPDNIEHLERSIKEDFKENFEISYKEDALIVVADFFISLLGSVKEKEFIPVLEAYIGEAWLHYFEGKWALCPESNDSAYLKPVIYWGFESTPRYCPYEEIEGLIEERNKDSILDSINYSKEMLEKHKKAREILFGDFNRDKKKKK